MGSFSFPISLAFLFTREVGPEGTEDHRRPSPEAGGSVEPLWLGIASGLAMQRRIPNICSNDFRTRPRLPFPMAQPELITPFQAPRPESYAPIPQPLRRRDVRSLDLPPGPSSPLLTLKFQRDTPGFLRHARDEYGSMVSFFLGGQLFIGAFGAEMVHDIAVSKQHDFIKGVGFERMRKVLGTGLLTNEEPIHLRHRRLMQSPFHISKISSYAQTMVELTRRHLKKWKVGEVVAKIGRAHV